MRQMLTENICLWTWSRVFLIVISILSVSANVIQYFDDNLSSSPSSSPSSSSSINPLPLSGLIINCVFIVAILISCSILIKLFLALLILYSLTLIALIITDSLIFGSIISYSSFDEADSQLTPIKHYSTITLILIGSIWFLIGCQIIGTLIYLKDIQVGRQTNRQRLESSSLSELDRTLSDVASVNLECPSIGTNRSTGSTYYEFDSTDEWFQRCSCRVNLKSDHGSVDLSKPMKWPQLPRLVSNQQPLFSVTI